MINRIVSAAAQQVVGLFISAPVQIVQVMLLVVLAAVSGCRSADLVGRTQSDWEVETFKRQVRSQQEVVLVCIYESHLQRLPLPQKHRLESKATVVRSYKGTWEVGAPISFYRELESVPKEWTPSVGHLVYLLLNKRSTEPIGIDTGEHWAYKPELERAFSRLPHKRPGA